MDRIRHWILGLICSKYLTMSAPETRVSLIMRVRDVRDEKAWSEFVTLYSPVVYAFVRSRGMREADGQDITQEVFRSLAKALPQFELDKSIGTFRNWLFTVTRSKLNNHLVKSQKLPVPTEHLPEEGDVSDWDNLYMKELFRHACVKVEKAVEPSSWLAFWRTAVELESPDAVASDLGLTVANVYQKRSRVASRLREVIRLADDEVLSEPPSGTGMPL
jgi:RNA polymerase sigma-70 factor (ECF subfamily)